MEIHSEWRAQNFPLHRVRLPTLIIAVHIPTMAKGDDYLSRSNGKQTGKISSVYNADDILPPARSLKPDSRIFARRGNERDKGCIFWTRFCRRVLHRRWLKYNVDLSSRFREWCSTSAFNSIRPSKSANEASAFRMDVARTKLFSVYGLTAVQCLSVLRIIRIIGCERAVPGHRRLFVRI